MHRKYRKTNPWRYWVQLKFHLGFRGRVLGLLGILWIGNGITVWSVPGSPNYPMLDSHPSLRGAMWILTGAVAIWAAFQTSPLVDRLGFVALYLMAAYRFFAYFIPFADWTSDDGGTGRAAVGAIVWLIILALLVLISGWPEPPRGDDE